MITQTPEPGKGGVPQTYLLTGGAGFIGSHLCDLLLARGHRVLVVDDLSTGKRENIAHLLGRRDFEFFHADIFSSGLLDRLAVDASVIVHLAATVGVERVVAAPVHTIENNVRGSGAVLHAALQQGCRVLLASTSEVYGKGCRLPFREDDDLLLGASSRRRWGYAASKLVAEFLALAHWHEYGLPVTIVRLFNTVGPRQTGRYGMVVPRLVGQALRDEPLTVYGDGEQCRCFCNVTDVARALADLSECSEAAGEVFNIGSQEEVSILELARRILQITGSGSEIRFIPYEDAYDVGFEDMRRRIPDTTRIQKLIGWVPEIQLNDTIVQVAAQAEGKSDATRPIVQTTAPLPAD